jgi:hypothetical protein
LGAAPVVPANLIASITVAANDLDYNPSTHVVNIASASLAIIPMCDLKVNGKAIVQ